MKSLRELGKKRLTLQEIRQFYRVSDQQALADVIAAEMAAGIVEPIKSSGGDGKKPMLYNRYRVLIEAVDYGDYVAELQFEMHSGLDISYYLHHLDKYVEDRGAVLALNAYWRSKGQEPVQAVSLNERSFEIWGREKFLQKEGGRRILKNLGLTLADLAIYETTEPLAYYAQHKRVPQTVLILENKDTFYSMRKHLLDGQGTILGVAVGTLIYGGGKNICKTFQDFTYCVEPYLAHGGNTILYFGDLDYEGIIIYESLAAAFQAERVIKPFCEAYRAMLRKSAAYGERLPLTKGGQNRHLGEQFWMAFSQEEQQAMLKILQGERYIPQEILTVSDF